MINIITHTPVWVFILFFFLLFLGFSQSKDRKVSFKKAMILPFIMVILSFLGVLSAFGLDLKSLLFWLFGLSLGTFLNLYLKLPRDAKFIKSENLFFIKGSFHPLLLIMCIFFIKYFVGVSTAKEFSFIDDLFFILIISLLYGFFSGIFFGRVFVLKKLK